jgi:hypothetical protein
MCRTGPRIDRQSRHFSSSRAAKFSCSSVYSPFADQLPFEFCGHGKHPENHAAFRAACVDQRAMARKHLSPATAEFLNQANEAGKGCSQAGQTSTTRPPMPPTWPAASITRIGSELEDITNLAALFDVTTTACDLFQVTSNVWHECRMCQKSLKVGRRSWIGFREFVIK